MCADGRIGDLAVAAQDRQQRGRRAQLGGEVRVRQLDALGRTGRSRGVDQGHRIVRADRSPRRLEVELLVAVALERRQREGALGLPVDADDMLDRAAPAGSVHALRELRLADRHAGAALARICSICSGAEVL